VELPRVSVVTCSYNQGRFLGRTVESVLAQGYPEVEHIVVDGMSADETPAVLARYPHLHVVREPDRGQAEAINKGFRLATGDVFCFLNSDDTLLPGALHRVAAAIDPGRGRHVVFGRCLHIDENDRPLGFEHPSAFLGHRRVLEVWKGHWVPQPATFWTRQAWRRCGPLDEAEHLVLDFDLMCRLSRHYPFTFVDEPLAAYRLHTTSKTCSATNEQVYGRAVQVSRRYWGSPLTPRYWRLLGSLAGHRLEEKFGRKRRAADLVLRGREALAARQKWRGLARLTAAAALAPRLAFRRALLRRGGHLAGRTNAELWQERRLSPRTLIWRGFTDAHPDRYVGPTYRTTLEVGPGDRWLRLDGSSVLGWLPLPPALDVAIDGRPVGRHPLSERGPFSLAVPLAGLAAGGHELEVTAGAFVVVNDYLGNGDDRPLSYWLGGLRLTGEKE
jgi:glycosyltransferase involved in cell wall biosynthesis